MPRSTSLLSTGDYVMATNEEEGGADMVASRERFRNDLVGLA
jgi:hypothetical protein